MISKEKLRQFWRDERGQSTTEYILILAVVVMIASQFRKVFKSRLEGIVTRLGAKIDEASQADE